MKPFKNQANAKNPNFQTGCKTPLIHYNNRTGDEKKAHILCTPPKFSTLDGNSTPPHHLSETTHPIETLEKAERALSFISADLSRNEWFKILTALKTEFGDDAREIAETWSSNAPNHSKYDFLSTWKSARTGLTQISTLYYFARQNGYTEKSSYVSKSDRNKQDTIRVKRKAKQAERKAKEKALQEQERNRAVAAINEIIPHLTPARPSEHTYLKNKLSSGVGAFTINYDDLPINGVARYTYPLNQIKGKKALFIPFRNDRGDYVGAQCIYGGRKRLIKGSIAKGSYAWLSSKPETSATSTICIGEGYATVNSVMQAQPNIFGVMAKDANNLEVVAKIIRTQHPKANIIILGDNDVSNVGQKAAQKAAKSVNGGAIIPDWIDLNQAEQKSTDWNDAHMAKGLDAVSNQTKVTAPTKPHVEVEKPKKLSVEPLQTLVNDKPAITIDQQYLGRRIQESLHKLGVRFIVVKSGMKTGKTTAAKIAIKDASGGNFLLITSRRNLNRALAAELKLNFYENVKNERHPKIKEEMAKRMAITPNSLVAILRDFPDIKYKTIFIDESETAASMLVSKATEKKVATLETLKIAALKAGSVILMDAHAGVMTDALMDVLSGNSQYGYLINKYKPWTDIKYTKIIAHSNNSMEKVKQKEAMHILIKRDLRNGERLYICSSSKKYCESIYSQLKKEFAELKIALIDSDTKYDKNIDSLLANPDSCVDYDVIIASPSIAVGVSFDPEHFHKCYGYFSNTEHTGMPDDAIQAMARPRNLIKKQWLVALPERAVYSNVPETPNEIGDAFNYRLGKNIQAAKILVPIGDTTEMQLVRIYETCAHQKYQTKNNFEGCFISRLNEMGCTESDVSMHELEIPKSSQIKREEAIATTKTEIQELTGIKISDEQYQKAQPFLAKAQQDENEKAREEGRKPRRTTMPIVEMEKAGIIPEGGRKLTEEEYHKIKLKQKFDAKNADPEMVAAMPRYQLEKKLGISFDDVKNDPDELRKQMELVDIVPCCIRREKAESSSEFTRKYTKSLLCGIGEDNAFKADIVSDKLNFVLERKMYRYALPYIDGDKQFSHKSLKRSAMARWFAKNEQHINALQLLPIPQDWKNKPALLLKLLIKKIGLKVKRERVGTRKKREWVWTVDLEASSAATEYFNKRQRTGMNWEQKTEYIMSIYDGVVGYVISENDVIDLNMTPLDIKHISNCLQYIPVNEHKQTMEAYKLLAKRYYVDYANRVLEEEAKKGGLEGMEKAA